MQKTSHQLFYFIILIINVGYYIQTRLTHGFGLTNELSPDQLAQIGGLGHNYTPMDLITSSIQHGSVIHIISNMIVLYIVMTMYNQKLGFIHLTLVYIASTIGASIAVVTFSEPNIVTVGASGAVLGMMGNGLVHAFADSHARDMLPSIGAIVVIQIANTYMNTDISVSGHIGGLVTGMIVGILYQAVRYLILGITKIIKRNK